MTHILLFAFGIMYTPGPVNLLALNNGLQGRLGAQVPFSLGVAVALFLWFVLVGHAGSGIVSQATLPWIGIPGCAFIVYLAVKIMRSKVDMNGAKRSEGVTTFRDGLLIQLLNPKAFMVVLPVTTIQFPEAGITGAQIAVWSALLALMGFGAPTTYAALGALLGQRINRPLWFRAFNAAMGALLLFVAADMAVRNVILPLAG